MTYRLTSAECRNLAFSANREWLLTNGIGGYAMGTPSGLNTRRYHGLLVAATKPPTDRMVLLAGIETFIQSDGQPVGLSAHQYPGAIYPQGYLELERFSAGQIIEWNYRRSAMGLDIRLSMSPGRNAIRLQYVNSGTAPIMISLKPLVCHKPHHQNFHESSGYPDDISYLRDKTVVQHDGISICFKHEEFQRLPVEGWYYRFEHARESDRGLDPRDDLFCPFELRREMLPGEEAFLDVADETEFQRSEIAMPKADPFDLGEALNSAAEKFVVRTHNRTSIIAGYPWFTDWGRDTMIALPGILLVPKKYEEARALLLDYASQIRDGLIPNRFVEDGDEPDFNTVDATLWFVNAVYSTLQADWNQEFAESIFPRLTDVFVRHMEGTRFGIGVDPEDGLLRQGGPGLQLTWMDAKIGDWVVTPRGGKPVEIAALWINALRCIASIAEKLGHSSDLFVAAAERGEANFERKFWHEVKGHYLDTVDPIDASLRPNQLIAMSLPFGPAKGENAKRALGQVAEHLLTARGLRTLAPFESDYRGRFEGPLPELDSAYHRGTVWPWLLGPYIFAQLRVCGNVDEAKRVLRQVKPMLTEFGLGGIAEVYDGDLPQRPNGCPWQAWSVAEIYRAWDEIFGANH